MIWHPRATHILNIVIHRGFSVVQVLAPKNEPDCRVVLQVLLFAEPLLDLTDCHADGHILQRHGSPFDVLEENRLEHDG